MYETHSTGTEELTVEELNNVLKMENLEEQMLEEERAK